MALLKWWTYYEGGRRHYPKDYGTTKEMDGTAKVIADITNQIETFFINFGLYFLFYG